MFIAIIAAILAAGIIYIPDIDMLLLNVVVSDNEL